MLAHGPTPFMLSRYKGGEIILKLYLKLYSFSSIYLALVWVLTTWLTYDLFSHEDLRPLVPLLSSPRNPFSRAIHGNQHVWRVPKSHDILLIYRCILFNFIPGSGVDRSSLQYWIDFMKVNGKTSLEHLHETIRLGCNRVHTSWIM